MSSFPPRYTSRLTATNIYVIVGTTCGNVKSKAEETLKRRIITVY